MRIGLIDVDGKNFPNIPLMKAIVVETGKEVEVERGEPMDNPWGWASQMWLTDKEGNMYHEDELVMI